MKHLAYLIADPIISKIQSRNYHRESFYNFCVQGFEDRWEIEIIIRCGPVVWVCSRVFLNHEAYGMHDGVFEEIVRDFVEETLINAARLPDTRGK